MWTYAKINGRIVQIRIVKYRKPKRETIKLDLRLDHDVLARAFLSAKHDIPPEIPS